MPVAKKKNISENFDRDITIDTINCDNMITKTAPPEANQIQNKFIYLPFATLF